MKNKTFRLLCITILNLNSPFKNISILKHIKFLIQNKYFTEILLFFLSFILKRLLRSK